VKYDTTSCIAFDSPTSPRRIRVVLPPRHVDAAFGGIVGYSGGDVVAAAVAQARDRSMQDCSLCVSGHLDVDGTVQADGDGSIIAGSGQVHGGGHVELTLDAVDANAGIGFEDYPPNPAPFSDRYSPQPLQAPTQDPFAGAVTAPSLLPTNRPTDLECGDTDTVRADTAYRSVTVTGSCTVEPGTVFIVGLLRVDSDGSLTQSSSLATTLYFGCRQRRRAAPCTGGGTRQGTLEVDPGGRLDLTTGGAVTGPWPLSILYDRGNDATMSIDGSASTGSVYLPGGNDVSVGRDGQLAIDGLLSVGSLTLVDGGQVAVTATGLGSRAGAFRVALAR
jgi:hypothetical protein